MPSISELKLKTKNKGLKGNISGTKIDSYIDDTPTVQDINNDLQNRLREHLGIKTQEDKQTTYELQTDDIQPTNGLQLDDKQTSDIDYIKLESVAKKGNRLQTDVKKDDKDKHKQTTYELQLDDKQTSDVVHSLSGNELKISRHIFYLCKSNASLETPPIILSDLTGLIGSSKSVAKKSIERLVDKKVISRGASKVGRSGWMKFVMGKQIYNEFLIREKEWTTFGLHLDYKQTSIQTSEQTTLPPSSSNLFNINNKNTTTNTDYIEPQKETLPFVPNEWQAIDIEPLENIGFTNNHLTQICLKNKLTANQVQDSIHAFAFDIKNNNKTFKTSPLNMFMGILSSKGEPYLPPDNYEHPRDKAMREYIERKDAQNSRRKELEGKAFCIAFDEWRESLSVEEILQITDVQVLEGDSLGLKIAMKKLKQHYNEVEWPFKRNVILNNKN